MARDQSKTDVLLEQILVELVAELKQEYQQASEYCSDLQLTCKDTQELLAPWPAAKAKKSSAKPTVSDADQPPIRSAADKTLSKVDAAIARASRLRSARSGASKGQKTKHSSATNKARSSNASARAQSSKPSSSSQQRPLSSSRHTYSATSATKRQETAQKRSARSRPVTSKSKSPDDMSALRAFAGVGKQISSNEVEEPDNSAAVKTEEEVTPLFTLQDKGSRLCFSSRFKRAWNTYFSLSKKLDDKAGRAAGEEFTEDLLNKTTGICDGLTSGYLRVEQLLSLIEVATWDGASASQICADKRAILQLYREKTVLQVAKQALEDLARAERSGAPIHIDTSSSENNFEIPVDPNCPYSSAEFEEYLAECTSRVPPKESPKLLEFSDLLSHCTLDVQEAADYSNFAISPNKASGTCYTYTDQRELDAVDSLIHDAWITGLNLRLQAYTQQLLQVLEGANDVNEQTFSKTYRLGAALRVGGKHRAALPTLVRFAEPDSDTDL